MAEALTASSIESGGHRLWTRICHWIVAFSFLVLGFSGFVILMAHPRLYWGEVGNALTPAILELPISNNHRPEGWEQGAVFTEVPNAPISANRMYLIFNENSWARSLHFLAAWFFVLAGAYYAFAGLFSGHIRRNLLPRARELMPQTLWRDLKAHLSLRVGSTGAGSPYGLLQRCTYASVAFILLPFMVVSGLTMSPAVTAAYPILLDVFGGYQSARTLHFAGFVLLFLFFIIHVAMVALTGFRRQLCGMILGK
jgi:thiosulfate reductase cytochrome b subunit